MIHSGHHLMTLALIRCVWQFSAMGVNLIRLVSTFHHCHARMLFFFRALVVRDSVFDVEDDADLSGLVPEYLVNQKAKICDVCNSSDEQLFGQISLYYEILPNFDFEQTVPVQALSTQAAWK